MQSPQTWTTYATTPTLRTAAAVFKELWKTDAQENGIEGEEGMEYRIVPPEPNRPTYLVQGIDRGTEEAYARNRMHFEKPAKTAEEQAEEEAITEICQELAEADAPAPEDIPPRRGNMAVPTDDDQDDAFKAMCETEEALEAARKRTREARDAYNAAIDAETAAIHADQMSHDRFDTIRAARVKAGLIPADQLTEEEEAAAKAGGE